MDYLSSVLSNTYVLGSLPIIIFLAVLAVRQKDGKVFGKATVPWLTTLPIDVFSSNAQSKLTWIEDLFFLRKAPSPAISNHERNGPTTEAGLSTSVNVFKESEFPENWWTGDDVFRLEQRALFSKTWLYVAHISRFTKPGDYHTFEICGFPLFLIQGKDGIIRAFHNVCRHRAYPVISKKKSGSSTVMGCRYHGWSYDTKGHLVKAPQFECLPGFDKTQNSLFEIRTEVTKQGLIFVNLDARDEGSELKIDVRETDRVASANGISRRSVWIDGWEAEGRFNWKMGGRNLHHSKSQMAEMKQKSRNLSSVLQSIFGVGRTGQLSSSGLEVFPTTSIHVTGKQDIWYSITVVPMEVNRSYIRCDVYGTAAGKQEDRSDTIQANIKSSIESWIAEFESAYKSLTTPHKTNHDNQNNLEAETVRYSHNHRAQTLILSQLKSHLKLEKIAGEEIMPTVRRSSTSDRYNLANELCKELENIDRAITPSPACQTIVKESLSW
ncbi:hypothetical protein AJ78_06899 [Emergomyces pasteurianus Ep9510]|uniref:Rieske domain-containing protein n=1 Tax=Emergomyces pasteurianus Ep9510 TaxID=1447872 RepID=A0A1J9QBI9_9EURO|nr:hypothetical protein AJ78_06899 [Emergomyces pasteurianus Ep9510]